MIGETTESRYSVSLFDCCYFCSKHLFRNCLMHNLSNLRETKVINVLFTCFFDFRVINPFHSAGLFYTSWKYKTKGIQIHIPLLLPETAIFGFLEANDKVSLILNGLLLLFK